MTGETTNTSEAEGEIETQAEQSSSIYVDDSASATFCYSEESVSYPALREAITAWQALPHDVKRITSIQSDGARYEGWAIYRLWGR